MAFYLTLIERISRNFVAQLSVWELYKHHMVTFESLCQSDTERSGAIFSPILGSTLGVQLKGAWGRGAHVSGQPGLT